MDLNFDSREKQEAAMALGLLHEISHTFGMYEAYKIYGHDIDSPNPSDEDKVEKYDKMECAMEAIVSNDMERYYDDLRENQNNAVPFCDDCLHFMEQLVPMTLHKGN